FRSPHGAGRRPVRPPARARRAGALIPGVAMTTLTTRFAPPSLRHPEVVLHAGLRCGDCLPRLEAFLLRDNQVPLSRYPAWLAVLERGLGHTPYVLEAVEGGRTRGFLPLACVSSLLFGRFLVSLPYLNYGGPVADSDDAERALLDRAVRLADELKV